MTEFRTSDQAFEQKGKTLGLQLAFDVLMSIYGAYHGRPDERAADTRRAAESLGGYNKL